MKILTINLEETKNYCSDYKRLIENDIPFLIECDIKIPLKIKKKTKNFPFLPVNRTIKYWELSDYQKTLLRKQFENLNLTEEEITKKCENLMGKDKKLILDLYDKLRYVITS